jgi:hypothetical protein
LPSSIDVQRSNDAFWASTAMTALLSGHLGLRTTQWPRAPDALPVLESVSRKREHKINDIVLTF